MLSHLFFAVLLVSWSPKTIGSSTPLVYVPGQEVTYQGSSSGTIEHFQGIRYAKDTSGELRFAPPEPYVPDKDSVIDASHAGLLCPQIESAIPLFFDETPEMAEDCLNLRIARPAGVSHGDKLPVVVWLHGGAVVVGSAHDSHFNPDNLLQRSIADGTPVIYAAVNYRMTILGFPRLPLLKAQHSLNLGVRDQRLALEWIQENIHAFGGNPELITVYGLSAGGTFASLHTLAYGGQRGVPFHQAWMMSGPPGTAMNMTSDATTSHTLNVAKRLNCGESAVGDVELLRCLRAVPMEELLDVALSYSRENHPPFGAFTFIPSVDDDFFPDSPSRLIRDGRFVKGINMVFGWTQDDGALNIGGAQAIQVEEDIVGPIQDFASRLSPTELSGLFAVYPEEAFQQELENYESRKSPTDPTITVHFFRLSRILRDLLFTCSSITYGYRMVEQTRLTQPDFDNVRLYVLNQSVFTPMTAAAGMPYLGTIHGSDTPYIFNGFPEGDFSETDRELATLISRSLIRFAYTGAPTLLATSEKNVTHEWPTAYESIAPGDTRSIPSAFNVEVIGGPYGTGPVLVRGKESEYHFEAQEVLGNVLNFAGMTPIPQTMRERLILEEDLHKRCEYLSTLDESIGR